MIRRLGGAFAAVSQRIVPEPFVFAIILTVVTIFLGKFVAGSGYREMIGLWGDGLMNLLAFTTQMCLILITGHALASSPPVKRAIAACARVPNSPFTAVALTAFLAAILGLINWGFALIGGAIFCREVAGQCRRKGIAVSYPLLVASAYAGLMIWHGGLSGSAPLLVATGGHFLEAQMGVIPITKTLGASYNLIINAVLLATLPVLMGLMCPKKGEPMQDIPDHVLDEESPAPEPQKATLAARLENSRLVTFAVAAIGAIYICSIFSTKGFGGVNLNSINVTFLMLGIIFHRTPIAYVRAIAEAVKGCSGILLQFPFYAGIMSMMAGSGLVGIFANWFVGISTAATYPIFTFMGAGVVNIFIPSGGGQWAAQGPIMVEAATKLGVDHTRTLMSFAYGDQVTNMLQPFWTLPLLGLTKLQARDIMGYAAVAFILGFIIMGFGVAFLPG